MHLLIVDDDDTLRLLLGRELGRTGHRVELAATAAEALARVHDAEPDVVLLDLTLPDRPGIDVLRRLRADRPALQVVVLTAHGSVETALTAMKLGAFDYLQKPCHLEELELTLRAALERRRLGEDNARLRDGLSASGEGELVGTGRAFEDLQRLIRKVAASDSAVLIGGPTGTGKDVVARSLHRQSPRREQPFVVVDCAAMTDTLLQTELFGHEKGAFTGADKLKYGLFEAAHGGTLFLDEVGDVSSALQAGLLRILETSAFRRVGGTREVRVDVRLIAATNRDLDRLIRQGQFRSDLYFRLSTLRIDLLPLRQRPEEIPCLVEHFVARHNARAGARRRLSPELVAALARYRWPGNVRELRHVVESMLVLADSDVLTPADLPAEISRETSRGAATLAPDDPLPLAEVERRHIARVLAACGGHRAQAAQMLGISQRTLYRKILEEHIDAPEE